MCLVHLFFIVFVVYPGWDGAHTCHGACVGVRQQLVRANSLSLPCGSRDRTQIVRLSCKHLGALGLLAGHISISKVTPGQFVRLTHAFVYLCLCVM